MIDQICAHVHNYFTDPDDIRAGDFTISDGTIDLPFLVPGQYFRIVNSMFNDAVWQYPPDGMTDETFTGEIWPMKLPRAFLDTVSEIEAWQSKYGAAMASPFQSENVIGVYSYTKQGGNTSVNGTAAEADGWKSAFRAQLNRWRKLR